MTMGSMLTRGTINTIITNTIITTNTTTNIIIIHITGKTTAQTKVVVLPVVQVTDSTRVMTNTMATAELMENTGILVVHMPMGKIQTVEKYSPFNDK